MDKTTERKEEMHTSDRRQESTVLVGGTLRTSFGLQDCKTVAYPSSGGIVLGYLTGAELAWLGLSRLEETQRSSSPDEEDAFAFQMLRLGARWWPSWKFYSKHSQKMAEIPYGYHFPLSIHVGYPSKGGVWVLKTANDGVRLPDDAEERPEDWAKAVMACTMDERCAVLERLGAIFYANVEECPDVPKSLEEGTEIGRRYECLLKNMEDDSPGGYLDRWLDSL
jgi:hypothetical protein